MSKRRGGLLVTAAFGIAGLIAVLLPATAANAHGAYIFPKSRTYACYVNGIEGGNGGNIQPTNPACQQVLDEEGIYPFYDWFSNLISDVGDQHQQRIPDGELCGPTEDFSAFNAARTDWPATELNSGATYTFRWAAWAPHPGTFFTYITEPGFDPNQPLAWGDLQLIDEVTDPPQSGSGPEGAEYEWDVTLPNRSGRHIVYTVWQRSDSPESFYSCSDVIFSGSSEDDTEAPTAPGSPSVSNVSGSTADLSWGASSDNVGVSGYDVIDAGTGAQLASTSGTSVQLTGLSAETDYTVEVVARDAAGNTSSPSSVSFTTGTAPPQGQCEVSYSVASEWSGGFTGNITISNPGDSAINGWTLEFDFPGDQSVTNGWNGSYSQSGSTVTVENAGHNGTIQPGGSVSTGFNGSYSADNTNPSSFLLNGQSCTTG